MDEPVYALLFIVLASALLAAIVLPAPAYAAHNEAGIHLSLLAAATLMTVMTGAFALAQLTAASAICGAIAWLLVMPCVWLVRAPGSATVDWYEEDEEDDDDGGSSRPHQPSAPSAPEPRLPGLRPSAAPTAARLTWAPAQATPVVATATTVQHMLAAVPARLPNPVPVAFVPPPPAPAPPAPAAHPRELQAPPRHVRGDHRSIEHLRAGQDFDGRRRRASMSHRVLHRCRLWLWPAPPECSDLVTPDPASAHQGRQHATYRPAPDSQRTLQD